MNIFKHKIIGPLLIEHGHTMLQLRDGVNATEMYCNKEIGLYWFRLKNGSTIQLYTDKDGNVLKAVQGKSNRKYLKEKHICKLIKLVANTLVGAKARVTIGMWVS